MNVTIKPVIISLALNLCHPGPYATTLTRVWASMRQQTQTALTLPHTHYSDAQGVVSVSVCLHTRHMDALL